MHPEHQGTGIALHALARNSTDETLTYTAQYCNSHQPEIQNSLKFIICSLSSQIPTSFFISEILYRIKEPTGSENVACRLTIDVHETLQLHNRLNLP